VISRDLPEDLQGIPNGVLMNVLGIDPSPQRLGPLPESASRLLPPHLLMDPFDPRQADAWAAAVAEHEASR
jgi:hypothetical protein